MFATAFKRVRKWFLGWLKGGPHEKINDYLWRWYILPRNPICNIYIHKFLRDDDDRALHDHPWPSVSLIINNGYVEYVPSTVDRPSIKFYKAGSIIFRAADYKHRIVLVKSPTWTLFITGPKVREWGFWCPQGWRPWREFDKKGCD